MPLVSFTLFWWCLEMCAFEIEALVLRFTADISFCRKQEVKKDDISLVSWGGLDVGLWCITISIYIYIYIVLLVADFQIISPDSTQIWILHLFTNKDLFYSFSLWMCTAMAVKQNICHLVYKCLLHLNQLVWLLVQFANKSFMWLSYRAEYICMPLPQDN